MAAPTTAPAAAAAAARLSLAEILDFIPALLSISVVAVCSIVTGLWRSQKQAKTFFLHVGYAIFRKSTVRLSPLQMQAILPSTNKVYELYTRKTRTPAQSVTLNHGAFGHWTGDKNADNVVIWFHGGGFSLPANVGYFQFFARTIADMKAAGKSVAVFSLSYTLAQHGPYPTQLRQAVECLRYVVEQTEHKPSRIFLGGDSAGGNLVGGVLSHLTHPHPQIQRLTISEKLAGAVMISPWTLLDAEFPDRVIYSGGDIITEGVAGPWAKAYIGGGKRDHYTDLSTAPADWYKEFPVQKVLITGGGNEILLPVIEEFAEKFKDGFPREVELFIGKRECHVAPIYDLFLGDTTETEQGKRVNQWLRELLH